MPQEGHRELDIVVAGEINVDLILTGPDLQPQFGQEKLVDDATLTMGSSSVIFACQAARLGLRVALIGNVGGDALGEFMLRGLQERGVHTEWVRRRTDLKTGITVSLSGPGDRAMFTYPGCIPTLRAADVPDELLRRTRHLHVGSAFLQEALLPELPSLLGRARECGCSTSLDTGWDPHERWNGAVQAALQETTVFLPNEEEAPRLAAASTPEQALEALAQRIPIVAIKLGAKGAIAARGAERCRCPAYRVPVVDTTGAGDSFDAGFVYGFLQGWPLERCLKLGCACGALSTRALGGTTAQPSLAEALALMES